MNLERAIGLAVGVLILLVVIFVLFRVAGVL